MVSQSNQDFIQLSKTDMSNPVSLPSENVLAVSSLQFLNQDSSEVRFKY